MTRQSHDVKVGYTNQNHSDDEGLNLKFNPIYLI